VTLTANPATGSDFSGWSGGGCSGTATCTVTMDQTRSVSAVFTLQTHQLDVTTAGSGSGYVGSAPAGIDCQTGSATHTDCSEDYAGGSVTLTANPATGSDFSGWSGGGCSGTGTCTVSMDQARSVTATFTARPPVDPAPEIIKVKPRKRIKLSSKRVPTIRIRLSEAAEVEFTVWPRSGGKAVPPAVGSFTRNLEQGKSKVPMDVDLELGRYVLRAVATDSAGQHSRTRSVPFRVRR